MSAQDDLREASRYAAETVVPVIEDLVVDLVCHMPEARSKLQK